MDKQEIKESMLDVSNLGVAIERYNEGREFWLKYFPGLTLEDLFDEISLPEKTMEDVIIQKVTEADNIDDLEYAAKMLYVVVVYQMGCG